MTKIPFTVTARTAKLIGQENFANAEGAVIELVKNAYDADALECLIIFTQEALYLIDTGIGMTEAVLKDSWMKIGTNDKLLNYQSKLGRVKTGAKGIGRFALDRLGKKARLLTKTKDNKNILKWSLDWEQFDKPGIVIGKVMADLDTVTNLTMKSHFLEEFRENKVALNRLSEVDFTQGTSIKITNVKDDWSYEDIQNLFNSLEISSDTIGETVMAALAEVDTVGYVRFASVYRNFTEASDFETFIQELRPPSDPIAGPADGGE